MSLLQTALQRLQTTTRLYALVELKGVPYHITQNDLVTTSKMGLPLGTELRLDKIRELGSHEVTLRGDPYVENVDIRAIVVENWQSDMKYKQKIKGAHRHQPKRGSRHHLTTIQVTQIKFTQ